MSYTPYKVFALIAPEATIDFAQVVDGIRAKHHSLQFPSAIEHLGSQCSVKRDDWTFHLYWEDEPYVLEDSREIAERTGANLSLPVVAACSRRITTAGDPDPDMKHFNDYVFVLEVLESFEGVYLFDPYDGKFLERDSKSL